MLGNILSKTNFREKKKNNGGSRHPSKSLECQARSKTNPKWLVKLMRKYVILKFKVLFLIFYCDIPSINPTIIEKRTQTTNPDWPSKHISQLAHITIGDATHEITVPAIPFQLFHYPVRNQENVLSLPVSTSQHTTNGK